MLLTFSRQFFPLTLVKFFFVNSPSTFLPSTLLMNSYDLSLYSSFQMFVPLKIAPAGTDSTWGKYGAFLNSFYPDVKRFSRRLERFTNRISRSEASVLFNQTNTHTHTLSLSHTHTHTHTIYIYIYIYMYVYFGSIFFFNTNFVEYNRHFLSTYFLVDPFILPYWQQKYGKLSPKTQQY